MRIGILGSGNIGGSLGRLWAARGHEVLFSSRNPASLTPLAERAGPLAQTGTLDEAIAFGDVILDAVPFHASVKLPPEPLKHKIVLTASNYYPQRDGQIDLHGMTETEFLAFHLPGARIVKAFNMMYAEEMEARAEGRPHSEIAIFYAGDDEPANDIAMQLIKDAQFVPIFVGGLKDTRVFQTNAPLYGERLNREEAVKALARALQH